MKLTAITSMAPINEISKFMKLFLAALFSTPLRGRKTQEIISNLLMCSMVMLVFSFLLISSPLSAETRTASITREAQNALEQGRSYHDRGDYRRAIQEFDRFIKLVPGRADAYYRRGTACYNLGDPNRAIQDYNKAIEINPKYVEAYHNRGTAYDKLGDLNRAIQDYDRAIKLRPYFAETYNNRGSAYVKLGNLDKGLKDFYAAIAWNPNFADAYYNRGTLHNRLGSVSQAIKDLDRAIELNPEYASAYYNRGVIYGKLGNKNKEKEDYDKTGKLNQESTDKKSMTVPGKDSDKTRELEEIKKRLDELARENERLRRGLAAAPDVRRQSPETAYNSDNKTIGNLTAVNWFDKGYSAALSGDYKEAINAYDKSIELDPYLVDAYNNRGIAYAKRGDFNRALQDYDRTIALNRGYAMAYYNKGLAFEKLGDPVQALENQKIAARLGFKTAQDSLKEQGTAW